MKAAVIFQLKLLKCSVDEENLAMKQNSAYYSTNTQKSASTLHGYQLQWQILSMGQMQINPSI